MNIRKIFGWKNKEEKVIPIEPVEVSYVENLVEDKTETDISSAISDVEELNSKKTSCATGHEECFQAVHKLFEEATENAMLKMPMWMRLNYFANTVGQTDGKDVNWEKVNRFLMLGIDKKKPYYNICGKIRNVKQLKQAAVDARLAAMPDFGMPFYRRKCKQCGDMFELTLGEIESYERKGLHIPGRCRYCRKGIDKHTGEHIIPKKIEEEPVKTEMQIALEKAGIC